MTEKFLGGVLSTWTLFNGQLTIDNGQWIIDNGQYFIKSNFQLASHCPLSTVNCPLNKLSSHCPLSIVHCQLFT